MVRIIIIILLRERRGEFLSVSKRERAKWGNRERAGGREGEREGERERERRRERERDWLRIGGKREMDQGEKVLLGNF